MDGELSAKTGRKALKWWFIFFDKLWIKEIHIYYLKICARIRYDSILINRMSKSYSAHCVSQIWTNSFINKAQNSWNILLIRIQNFPIIVKAIETCFFQLIFSFYIKPHTVHINVCSVVGYYKFLFFDLSRIVYSVLSIVFIH